MGNTDPFTMRGVSGRMMTEASAEGDLKIVLTVNIA